MQKIRYKKIRGKNRILRNIDDWVSRNSDLNLDDLLKHQRDYVKFWVRPFSNLNIGNSIYPEPDGIIKEKLLRGLFDIYQSWKNQLDGLEKPYYLKIWLFEKQISRSQVVCAIDDCLHFYDHTFDKIENPDFTKLNHLFDGKLSNFPQLSWQQGIDVAYIENTYLNSFTDTTSQEFKQAEQWFNEMKNRAYSTYIETQNNDGEFYYLVENDKVWIGG